MSAYKLKIRREVSDIELANTNPCDLLNEQKPAEGTIILGATGGGKTTLMEFLLGDKMTLKMKYGNPYLDSNSKNIGHGAQSKTDRVMIFNHGKEQIFIDTPGFYDTKGEYAEIKNHMAIRNIVECDKISGVRMAFIVPKSFIFYEANRANDLISFLQAIRNFIPDFSAKKWIDQTLIIVTKTESRTTTQNAIDAIKDGIQEIGASSIIITKDEKDFFNYLTVNKKVALFPLPKKPYNPDTDFKNPELRNELLDLIRKVPVVKVNKDDFKTDFKLDIAHGEVARDFIIAKDILNKDAEKIEKEVETSIEEYIKNFPELFTTIEYKNTKKVLEDLKHRPCNQKDNLFEALSEDFNGVNKLISLFCELDYSVKFLKKFIAQENLFIIEPEKQKLINVIEKIITYLNWTICTRNAYSTFFKFLVQKEDSTIKKNIDTVLKQNVEGYRFFGHETEDKVRNAILDSCVKGEDAKTATNNKRKLIDLRESNPDRNALDKLIKLVYDISKGQYPHYDKCMIKGFLPSVSQFIVEDHTLKDCKEIAIYGVYGITLAGLLELPGKNLIMIAPYIKVDDQKIKLDGFNAKEPDMHKNALNGAAGNLGENGGSFYGYSFEAGGKQLIISTKGGNGSNGQNGTKGLPGLQGANATKANLLDEKLYDKSKPPIEVKNKVNHQGWTWYQEIRCTDTGEEGQIGGQGGSGGEGGYGGLPGEVDFQIKGTTKEKEKYYSSISIEGTKGKDGSPGKGGDGGEHGDALCYIVEFPYSLFGFIQSKPDVNFKKEIPLPTKGGSKTYDNMQYPELQLHENAPDGPAGSHVPFHKSIVPVKSAHVNKEKHINEYVDFISKVKNIKDLLIQEDANGKSLSADHEEILNFFDNLRTETCNPMITECDFN